jgi:hypothetical protein
MLAALRMGRWASLRLVGRGALVLSSIYSSGGTVLKWDGEFWGWWRRFSTFWMQMEGWFCSRRRGNLSYRRVDLRVGGLGGKMGHCYVGWTSGVASSERG